MTVNDIPLSRFTGEVTVSRVTQNCGATQMTVRVDRSETHDPETIGSWCQENIHNGGKSEIVRSEGVARFTFADESDAAIFKMRWC